MDLSLHSRKQLIYALRRRNTTYKNPQIVAQHSFVAGFLRCFPFFTWRDQLDPQQKHLLWVEEMRRANWLIFRVTSKFVARQVVSLMKNEQQSQNLLLKVDAILFTQGEKREKKIDENNETMLLLNEMLDFSLEEESLAN